MQRFVRTYGSRPLHLVVVLACLLLAGYAWTRIFQLSGAAWTVVIWFVGAIVTHDLIFLPLYTLVYRGAYRGARVERSIGRRVPVLHHVIVPATVSGFLFVAWFPLILGLGAGTFRATTTVSSDVYLPRWLLITAGAFLLSALAYAVRAVRARGLPEVASAPRGEAPESRSGD